MFCSGAHNSVTIKRGNYRQILQMAFTKHFDVYNVVSLRFVAGWAFVF